MPGDGETRPGKPGRRRGIFPRFGVSEDVDREIQAHLELRARELVDQGWNAEEARTEALRLFGDQEEIARQCRTIARRHQRAQRRGRTAEMAWQDMRYGLRTLVKNPLFTLVAFLTLALGIGANTAIFSVVNGVLLRPLPYEHPDELVWVTELHRSGRPMSVAWPNFVDWRAENSSFEALAAFGSGSITILGGERPVRTGFAAVTEDFWKVFPVRPLAGRLLTPEDFDEGRPNVVVVSRGFWLDELGGRELEGSFLEINGTRGQVVGVVPDAFQYPVGVEVWGTLAFWGNSDSRTSHNWSVVGRLGPGVPPAQAGQEIDALTKRIVLREPDADPDYIAVGAKVLPLHEQVVGEARTPLLLLLGAAGLVLLVACTNLASTLLARGAGRAKELAVRASLGASRGRLVRQLLTESLVLAAMGALGGTGLAFLMMQGLHQLNPSSLPRLADVSIDGPVLFFTGAIALLTALLFGLFPARRLANLGVSSALKEGGRGNAPEHRSGIWPGLVGVEVALSIVLLMGSGLLVRSFQSLLDEDVGFDGADVATMSVSLSRMKYETGAEQAIWYSRFLDELEAQPGIRSAGLISSVPLAGSPPNGRMELDGDLNKLASGEYVVASGGAFETLDIPLLRGRLFNRQDGPDDPHVAIVNQAWVDEFWPGEDPIGKSVTGGGMDNFYSDRIFAQVVGVVGNVRYGGLGREPGPVVYFPYTQRPFRIQYGTGIVLEAATGEPGALVGPSRSILQRSDPDVPFRFRTMAQVVGDSLAERRFILLLLGGFSLTALLLAGVGIYGVIAHTVAQRTREMGIRLALGASPNSVLKQVMGQALRMVSVGLILGSAASLVLARTMESLLYRVGPSDPLTLIAVLMALTVVATLASWIPARAATRVNPMETMRAE